MIGPDSDAKVLIYTRPIDFRCGIDTLVAKVQHELHMSPWAGVVFVFRSKRKDRLKILWADETGVWLMTKAVKLVPLIGPSSTQGATMPSCLRPAMKVSVFQCPCGTLSISGSPLVAQPWVRVMFVLAQVSSMKTSRLGSIRRWSQNQRARRRATSGRSCSLAKSVFF